MPTTATAHLLRTGKDRPVMPEPLSPATSLGYQVNHLARLMAHALRDRIAPTGVVPGQFAQLLSLYERDGLTQAQLCERVHIEQPTMANTLGRMHRDGLIDRVPDPADGRRSLVMLTERAREVEGELVLAARAVNAAATHGLSRSRVTLFMETMDVIIDNLGGSDLPRDRAPAEATS